MPSPTFDSAVFDDVPRPDFADVVLVSIPGDQPLVRDPERWANQVFSVRAVPVWIGALFALRQAVVGVIGIPKAGPSVFDVDRVVGDEAVIATDERHLDFRCGVAVDHERRLLRVTTAVRLHGWRGRVYFAPVRLLHGPVTRAMAHRAATALTGVPATG